MNENESKVRVSEKDEDEVHHIGCSKRKKEQREKKKEKMVEAFFFFFHL